MADRTSFVTHHKKTVGDVAVDGLLGGMAAGLVMAAWLLVVGLIGGEGPAVTLGRFDPGGQSPMVGALMHLAVSGIYGVAFALIVRLLSGRWPAAKRYLWLLGVAYGVLVWLVAQVAVLPSLNQALAEIGSLVFLGAHAIYGLALGYLLSRHQND